MNAKIFSVLLFGCVVLQFKLYFFASDKKYDKN